MHRLRKLFEKPRNVWDSKRIAIESGLLSEYGLKNMRELWHLQTLLRQVRRNARSLLAKKDATRELQLLERAKRFLIRNQNATLDDVLSLTQRDVLERRLQTRVWKRNLAKTPLQSRQIITHGHIAINGKRVTSPGYLVPFNEEDDIDWYAKPIKAGPQPAEEEAAAPKHAQKTKPTPAPEVENA